MNKRRKEICLHPNMHSFKSNIKFYDAPEDRPDDVGKHMRDQIHHNQL